ncbi:MAG: LexA family protein [Eubacteriales bacterium]
MRKTISLPKHIFGSGEKYILIANGDSMIKRGIDNGDLVVVRRQKRCHAGRYPGSHNTIR